MAIKINRAALSIAAMHAGKRDTGIEKGVFLAGHIDLGRFWDPECKSVTPGNARLFCVCMLGDRCDRGFLIVLRIGGVPFVSVTVWVGSFFNSLRL